MQPTRNLSYRQLNAQLNADTPATWLLYKEKLKGKHPNMQSMQKILLIEPQKCAGCRTCEAICSFHHEKEFNPAKSRIHVLKQDEAGLDVPTVCLQCDVPACEKSCPKKAISRSLKSGAVTIDYELCTGCNLCAEACPYGRITIDVNKGKPAKCDLCNGKPACVEFCPTGAIAFAAATKNNLSKRNAAIKLEKSAKSPYK